MQDRPAEDAVWNALRGGLVSRALALVGDLRIARTLADGPMSVAEVAHEARSDPETGGSLPSSASCSTMRARDWVASISCVQVFRRSGSTSAR